MTLSKPQLNLIEQDIKLTFFWSEAVMIPCRIPIRFSLIKSLSVSIGAADLMRSLSGEYFNAPALNLEVLNSLQIS